MKGIFMAEPVDIALVVSDIDGTLITSNHEITDAVRQTAARLADKGITLTLASSRPPRSIRPLAELLGLKTAYAAFNGALIVSAEGAVAATSHLAPDVTARIQAIAHHHNINVWIYDETDWYASVRDPFTEREEHTSGFSANLDDYKASATRPATKLTVVGKPEFVAEAEKDVLSEFHQVVSASKSKPRFLDVTAFGMHKGSVITRLAQTFGVPQNRVAVIGDGPNDIEMFQQAGISIAMGQAVDEVRAAATYLTASNNDDGWSKGIEKYVLQGR
jgi:hypothetical protein